MNQVIKILFLIATGRLTVNPERGMNIFYAFMTLGIARVPIATTGLWFRRWRNNVISTIL